MTGSPGQPSGVRPGGGPRLRLRTALLAVALLAAGIAAYRSVRDRLAYCLALAAFYDASAGNAENGARWEGLSVEYGRSPDPAGLAARWDAAAECRARADYYRAAAYRPWLRLPGEPSRMPAGKWILPCPDDCTTEPAEASPGDPRPTSAKRKSMGG